MFSSEKVSRIDKLLKELYLKAIADEADFDYYYVYEYLKQLCVNDDERNLTLENDIEKLKNKINNLGNYCLYEDGHFLYFKKEVINYEDYVVPSCVKMYVPLDRDHFYEGASRLIDFLSKNNIVHSSKIAEYMRFDNIVIRVNTLEDAKKVADFVNSDEYIKEGVLKSNPFAFYKNGCNYAFDGSSSYNFCVSKLIENFIKEMVKDSKFGIDDVNTKNFYYWMNGFSNNLDAMEKYVFDNLVFSDEQIKIGKIDAYFIVNLVKLAIVSDDINDYYNYINVYQNNENYGKVYEAISNDEKYLNFDSLFSNKEEEYDGKKELFNELILTTMKKYPKGYDEKKNYLSGYYFLNSFMDEDINSVTRDNDLRDRVEKELSQQDVYEIVENSDIPGSDFYKKFNNYIKIVMLNDVIDKMKIGYPEYYLSNIDGFIKTNDNLFITNSVGEVRKLVFTLDNEAIKKLFLDLGVSDIYEYEEKYYGQGNSQGRKR